MRRAHSTCTSNRAGLCAFAGIFSVVFLAERSTDAIEIWSSDDGARSTTLDTALKWGSLLSHAPDDPLLFPERWSGVGLFRFRLGLGYRHGAFFNTELAYEHRARLVSENAGMGAGGVLPGESPGPFRIDQMDWELADAGQTFSYRHEIDRALVAFHPPWGEVTIGRQGIGLGRAALFGAVDIFSPFTPTEADREWRRGVDAVRAEWRVSDTSSIECIAALGERWDDSALLGRVRGYFGNMDGEILAGKRAEDTFYGLAVSSTAGDAEVHLEAAVFDVPELWPDGGLFGNDHLIGKAVVGGSYTFDVGDGLTLMGEYHYSGFGVEDITDAMTRLSDPAYQARYLRGDTQILGQHAIGIQAAYPFTDSVSGALMLLVSPADGSGLASPSLTLDIAESTTLAVSAFFPWGDEPSGGDLNSEYGATATRLFLQLSLYF